MEKVQWIKIDNNAYQELKDERNALLTACESARNDLTKPSCGCGPLNPCGVCRAHEILTTAIREAKGE